MSTYIDRVVNDNEYPYDMLVLADAEIAQLKATCNEWLRENGPGGWIDNLRAEVAQLKAERDALLKDAERTPMDRFENAIREVGVVAACEWFGHSADSEFTKETIRVLDERAAMASSSKGGK